MRLPIHATASYFLVIRGLSARICEIYSFPFLFLRVSDFLLLTTLVAYNNFSDTPLFISLSMSQVRGSSGYLKGKYDSHSSCLNCSACSRFNRCAECRSWSDSIWDLADKRRLFRGRKMGKKKESKEKQQKGFSAKRSSSSKQGFEQAASQDDPAGSTVISLDDDSLSGGTCTRFVSVIIGG